MHPQLQFSERLKLIVNIMDSMIGWEEMLAIRLQQQKDGWISRADSTLAVFIGDTMGLTPETARLLSQRVQQEIPELDNKPTAVLGSTPLITSITMLYSNYSPAQPVRAFTSLDGALTWLNVYQSQLFSEFPSIVPLMERFE